MALITGSKMASTDSTSSKTSSTGYPNSAPKAAT